MTPPNASEQTYVGSRAELLRRRWEHRLGRRLEVQTDRLMPGPNGHAYRADLVLQDPVDGLPVVVFEVKTPTKTPEQARANLRRILATLPFIKLLGGEEPRVVLLLPAGSEREAGGLEDELSDAVQLEVL